MLIWKEYHVLVAIVYAYNPKSSRVRTCKSFNAVSIILPLSGYALPVIPVVAPITRHPKSNPPLIENVLSN